MVLWGPKLVFFCSLQLKFWIFWTFARMQPPKWERIWESLSSISCTFPHLWKCVSLSNTFFWPHVPLHSTINRELDVKWKCVSLSNTFFWPHMPLHSTINRELDIKWKCVSLSNTFFWPHVPLHSTINRELDVKVVTYWMHLKAISQWNIFKM
jgi:hypothetical protein